MKLTRLHFFTAGIFVLLASCRPVLASPSPGQIAADPATETAVPPPPLPTAAPSPTANQEPPTPTAVPTQLASPASPTAAPPPTLTPTATPIGPCDQRLPGDGLLAIVTLDYGLSHDYAPDDLVPLANFLPVDVTLGYPTKVRRVIVEPLVAMVNAMRTEGLQPQIISGYRSYSTQAIAWDKWNTEYPERAAIISAPPGHSEHQLGTTLDFGSPELAEIVGEEIQFHTYFYQTSEGVWLQENAHKYGFTLSYSREAFELTGFYYEPWHYRYVGVELATRLRESGTFLAEYLLAAQPNPCIP